MIVCFCVVCMWIALGGFGVALGVTCLRVCFMWFVVGLVVGLF